MANLSWPAHDSSTSTAISTTKANLVNSVGFSDDHADPNSAVSRTNAIALGPTVSETTLSLGTAVTTNPEGWASAQGWDKYRALITELYPKLMLKGIMEVMAVAHNFRATEKMYKSRFTQWGLRKNAKRKGEGDQKSGREKRPIDRSRHLPAGGGGYLIPIVSSGNPQAMRSFTPLSHPVMTPPMFAIPERILSVIWDYFRGSFEAGTWISNGDGSKSCYSTKPTKRAWAHLNRFYDQTLIACRLFNTSSSQDAGKALGSAFAVIKDILLAEEPETLSLLFKTILRVRRKRKDQIACAILRQFSAMAMAVLGARHPICRISGLLSSTDPSQVDEIINRCKSSIGDHFTRLIGPMHYTTLRTQLQNMSSSGRSEKKLRDLLAKCENDLGLLDVRILYFRIELSVHCYDNYKYTEAKKLGQELLVHSQKVQSTGYRKRLYRAEGLYIIAISQYALGERLSAESHMIDAIALMSQTSPSRAATWLLRLEGWLLKQGREKSAAEMRARRRKFQESFESD